MSSVIYGPVSSWRLGRSLGIDLLPPGGKTCSFNCTYCQLGRTTNPLAERREFVSIDKVTAALKEARGVAADYATFSGMGEPTLASNLGRAIETARSILPLPIAVLTNASLMAREDVRQELALADVVIAKLDVPNEALFRLINRPVFDLAFGDVIEGLSCFSNEYRGKLVLQIMFVQMNKDWAPEIARVGEQLLPDEVQINTPLRPCAVEPLSPDEIAAIRQEFAGLRNVVTVYEAKRPSATPLDLEETLRRRPKL